MGRGAWWATVQGVAKSQTQLSTRAGLVGGGSTLDALSDILPAAGVHGAIRRGAGHAGRRTGPHAHADTARHEKAGSLPTFQMRPAGLMMWRRENSRNYSRN